VDYSNTAFFSNAKIALKFNQKSPNKFGPTSTLIPQLYLLYIHRMVFMTSFFSKGERSFENLTAVIIGSFAMLCIAPFMFEGLVVNCSLTNVVCSWCISLQFRYESVFKKEFSVAFSNTWQRETSIFLLLKSLIFELMTKNQRESGAWLASSTNLFFGGVVNGQFK